jgi:uncharacterized OsmC-like protein
MNAEELRAIQAPLKARYRDDPASARMTSRASGVLLKDRPACRVETSFGPFDAGLHPAAGGDGNDKCSIDLLLEAIVSCAGVTFNLVATAMGIPYRAVKVIAESDGDIRGALGVSKETPVGVTALRLTFEVDSPASEEQLQVLLRQTEKFCVVYQTLQSPPPFQVNLTRVTHDAREHPSPRRT